MKSRMRSAVFVLCAATAASLRAQAPEGTRSIATPHRFDLFVERVERATGKHGLGVVARASASRGAAAPRRAG